MAATVAFVLVKMAQKREKTKSKQTNKTNLTLNILLGGGFLHVAIKSIRVVLPGLFLTTQFLPYSISLPNHGGGGG